MTIKIMQDIMSTAICNNITHNDYIRKQKIKQRSGIYEKRDNEKYISGGAN